jgi:A/G-specific adenine glycosylase
MTSRVGAKDSLHGSTAEGDVLPNALPMNPLRPSIKTFRSAVWNYWKKEGRNDLPWRKTKDPYKVLVSEVMLQQTQVPRVIEKYKEFLLAFPNVETLAKSKLSDVLKVWSGMGYNRRGKYLRDAAIAIVKDHNGKVPRDIVSLRSLPGVGPYTASAVLIFAFNTPDTLIETNVRTAYIHHFFTQNYKDQIFATSVDNYKDLTFVGKGKVSDRELLSYIEAAAEGQDPRTWHWALMDYGSHLKKLHKNPSRASAHYVKQSKFQGSLRQMRGAILKTLQNDPKSEIVLRVDLQRYLEAELPSEVSSGEHLEAELPSGGRSGNSSQYVPEKFETALNSLARDGMIEKRKGKWRIT